MDISYYWKNKKGRAELAAIHTAEMEKDFHTEIQEAVKNSTIYSEDSEFISTNIIAPEHAMAAGLVAEDSVAAIMNSAQGKTAVLNFASYKEPGGGFMAGSRAQEESLCHESFLYNVLRQFQYYYDWNNQHKNLGLYLNRAIYTPNVRFKRDGQVEYCDVITCAAPNYSVGKKYGNVDPATNSKYLDSRIKFVLSIAAEQGVDTLILGAFGCGVFSQDATEVMEIFKKYLSTEFKCFDKVIFAIPNDVHSENYTKAYNVLIGEKED